jgi:hypothetical protein
MTEVDWEALPAADPLPSEHAMMRSLIEALVDSEAQIGAIRARQAMLYTSVTEVIELQDDGGSRDNTESVDDRTLDQRRADILADLLLAGAPAALADGLQAIRGHVQVTVPVLTLAGVQESGATLAGYGPIDPETARCLAADAPGWDRVMTHPVTGATLAVDRYRPSADLLRALRVRDEHCRFPGCRQPAHRCDVDHTHDAALGGETQIDNLAHLCRRHHTLKHATHWQVRQLGGGTLEWTSPTGLVYIDVPSPTLRFAPSADPPIVWTGDPAPF